MVLDENKTWSEQLIAKYWYTKRTQRIVWFIKELRPVHYLVFVFWAALSVVTGVWTINTTDKWAPVFYWLTMFSPFAFALWKMCSPRFTKEQLGAHINALRPQFENQLLDIQQKGYRSRITIHNVLDRSYPESCPFESGIADWFNIEIVGLYHEGIEVVLSIEHLREEADGSYIIPHWRNPPQPTDINAWLIGRIPYESISWVNFDGDEYYTTPHIHCYFDFKGQPYKNLNYCHMFKGGYQQTKLCFTEIVNASKVKREQ